MDEYRYSTLESEPLVQQLREHISVLELRLHDLMEDYNDLYKDARTMAEQLDLVRTELDRNVRDILNTEQVEEYL